MPTAHDVCPSDRQAWIRFSCSVASNSLQPHEPQHARPPCPSAYVKVQSWETRFLLNSFRLKWMLIDIPKFCLSSLLIIFYTPLLRSSLRTIAHLPVKAGHWDKRGGEMKGQVFTASSTSHLSYGGWRGGGNVVASFKDKGQGLQMNQWKKQNRAWALDRFSHHHPKAVVLLPHSFAVM